MNMNTNYYSFNYKHSKEYKNNKKEDEDWIIVYVYKDVKSIFLNIVDVYCCSGKQWNHIMLNDIDWQWK